MSALILDDTIADRLRQLSGAAMDPCYQCGTCTATCPLGVPVRKVMRRAQLGLQGMTIADGIWQCANCGLCELRCPRGVKITNVIHALRIVDFEGRKTPAKLEQALWGVYEDSNPWGGKKKERSKWAEGLDIKSAKGAKNILYVGCAASFDPRLQKVAHSLATILKETGVEFGILGEEENCCGDVVYNTGEEGFLEELIKQNIEAFKKTGAETVITISPHCYNMFKSMYPRYGAGFSAVHYTELLAGLLDQGKLKLEGRFEAPLTYHDPCFLGRYHGVYEAPRKLLENIPGVSLVEMDENKENALCCGGGGGLMWVDVPGERTAHQRVLQAADTGVSTLASSCPYCIQNFEDGVKTKGVKSLRVMDVAEVIAEARRK